MAQGYPSPSAQIAKKMGLRDGHLKRDEVGRSQRGVEFSNPIRQTAQAPPHLIILWLTTSGVFVTMEVGIRFIATIFSAYSRQ